MARQLDLLGSGYDERRPDVVFLSVEHVGLRTEPITRVDMSPTKALGIARGLIAAVQKLEEQREQKAG
jgi:hypothetical protein